MSFLVKAMTQAAAGNAGGGYEISRSLRFNSADSAHLSRTPASAGNRKTWTWSGWVKLSKSKTQTFFSCGNGSSDTTTMTLDFYSDQFRVTGWSTAFRVTSQVFRDYSSWYHIVVSLDTTQASAGDRLKIYINGLQVTSFATNNTISLNTDYAINQAAEHDFGCFLAFGSRYDFYDGMMTEVHFVDGQALTPSSFGETNETTGVWSPIAYAGTYGTNGFYLNFSDNSNTTAATLGADSSGNGNNWTPNNFSVTAGAGNDSLVDSPTPYGTDTGAGGQVRGNYATWNPLRNAATLTNGNLDISGPSNAVNSFATVGLTSGKWYWEVTIGSVQNTFYPGIGVNTNLSLAPSSQSGADAVGYMYLADGQKFNSNVASAYGASFTTNDVIGVALDMDAGTITFYKNGSTQGQAFSGITGTAVPVVISWTSSTCVGNFGQRPFAYTAPSGFKALCTTNLPEATILQGDQHFNTVTWTGDGATTATPITGVGFEPSLVWIKERTLGYNHVLQDAVRGVAKKLGSNLTSAENDGTTLSLSFGYISSFDSDGFTLESTGTPVQTNRSGSTYVGWNWKANGAGSSNTDGTITSTVSVNQTAGFSIVTYTGTGAVATIGHGLGTAPKFIITKKRSSTSNWATNNPSRSNPWDSALLLNSNAANTVSSTAWNNTAPTSTVFTVGTADATNISSATYVAYCFAEIPGYSSFGSYTGNGSADGPFVYTGFRPAFLMIKRSSGTPANWYIWDATRNTRNVVTSELYPNLSNSEANGLDFDFLSNGFKSRNTADAGINGSGETFIYICFAENPFKYALAR